MKITDIQSYPVWGGGRNFFFVVVDTDEGISGVGEGGLTSRELAVAGAVEHFKPLLIGQDPMRIEHLWQVMFRGGFFPAGKITCSAISAIDIALWDIKGKALGVPDLRAARRPGPRQGRLLPAHPAGVSVEALVENAQQHVDEGWKFVRWGLARRRAGQRLRARGGPSARRIKEFEAVREAVGDEIELCFDLHTRLDPPEAIQLCRAVEQYRPFFIEDPIRSESMQRLRHGPPARQRAAGRRRAVRQQVGVPRR